MPSGEAHFTRDLDRFVADMKATHSKGASGYIPTPRGPSGRRACESDGREGACEVAIERVLKGRNERGTKYDRLV